MNHHTETTEEETTMRLETLVAAMLVLSPIAGLAQTREGAASPRFSTVEGRMIDRNELLSAIVAQDPWLVRQILDLVAGRKGRVGDTSAAAALGGLDLSQDPDLAPAARTAAGSIELIDLLRRAREEKEAARGKPPTGRSAAGTVETIEMLRRAQDAKGTRK
jgi:hypothetical protein